MVDKGLCLPSVLGGLEGTGGVADGGQSADGKSVSFSCLCVLTVVASVAPGCSTPCGLVRYLFTRRETPAGRSPTGSPSRGAGYPRELAKAGIVARVSLWTGPRMCLADHPRRVQDKFTLARRWTQGRRRPAGTACLDSSINGCSDPSGNNRQGCLPLRRNQTRRSSRAAPGAA